MSCEIKYFERNVLHCEFLNPSGFFSVFEKIFHAILRQKFLPKKTLLWFLLNTFCEPGSSVNIVWAG